MSERLTQAEIDEANETIAQLTAERDRLAAQIKEAGDQKPIFWYREREDTAHTRGDLMQGFVKPLYAHPPIREGWVPTDSELTEIYNTANGIGAGKSPPISTEKIFTAMLAMLSAIKKD